MDPYGSPESTPKALLPHAQAFLLITRNSKGPGASAQGFSGNTPLFSTLFLDPLLYSNLIKYHKSILNKLII